MLKRLLFSICLLFITTVYSQTIQEKIDSLYSEYPNIEHDSSRIKHLIQLSRQYHKLDTFYSMDSALATIERSYLLARKEGNQLYSKTPFITYAKLNKYSSNYDRALEILFEYREIAKNNNRPYWETNALENIVSILDIIGEKERADQYMEEHKKVTLKMDRGRKQGWAFNALGSHYKNRDLNDSALFYHNKSLDIKIEENDSLGIAYSYNNIGLVHKNNKEYNKALKYYLKSLAIKEDLNDTKGMAGTNINIGKLYLLKKDYSAGIPYVKEGIELTKKAKAKNFRRVGYTVLYELQSQLGNYKEAFEALMDLRQLESEIQNEKQIELAKELERKYNTEKHKQQAKISALELENSKVTLSRQKNIIWFLGIGVFVFIILIILVLVNYRQKKKINQQLEENNVLLQQQKLKTENQNILLARKNKEITDSINYAKRIQEAILPSRYTISESINNGFIVFKPKDVVSGDFYWMEEKNDRLYLAAADCTGHGVPGAMVSVICSNALSKALLEEDIEKPGRLLDRSREIVIEQFQKSSDHVKDGMDISLAVIDKKKSIIEWSGANNPLWIIRSNQTDKVEEIRPDKQPVGVYDKSKPFTTHVIEVSSKDKIYMFSDGFVDQFGGKKNKKFKPAQFRRLLLEIQELSMKEQKSALKDAFESWKGNNEQVDDVCIIGYEI